MAPAIKAACSAAEQALGERFWAEFKQWITDKERLKRLHKPMQQELQEEIEADIEAEQRANWVDSIAKFFLPCMRPCMSCVNPLMRCQETLYSVWISCVTEWGTWFTIDTAPLVSIQTNQPIKETRLPIGEKIE
ncbi:hypothetical protein [Cardinium endosymbiont of Sogatella furcifera]|uniref:hypothetical protein n=1 Tax=Cardinium endosymbiont of Sogatella furcifera TaxID=650378 RepID=UPI0013B40E93|nr:hypothetical protein [Cardinium endosymbiont of Sogatella furcifera]